MQLPEKFKHQVRQLVGNEAELFFESIQNEPQTSIRLNPFKANPNLAHFPQIPWCNHAVSLSTRPSFIADPLFHAGTYYVQEASSMFLDVALKHIKTQITEPIKVLDLCAAPGGKSTLILDNLSDDDLLVANEIIKTRVPILEENIVKWGRSNVVITNNDPRDFSSLHEFFDVIVVDAPCSGEGMFRKDKHAIDEWSEEHVALCASRQQRILDDILPALKPTGFLVYSTCTFNTSENEQNVIRLQNNFGMQSIQLPLCENWQVTEVTEFQNSAMFAYRFYPHKVSSEGFFLACLKNNSDSLGSFTYKEPKREKNNQPWLGEVSRFLQQQNQVEFVSVANEILAYPKTHFATMLALQAKLKVRLAGVKMGEIMKGKLLPHHQLAQSIHLNTSIPKVELNLEQALRYLRNETFPLPQLTPNIYILCYKQQALGWAKVMPNRINNYHPNNLRILKDLKDLLPENK